MTKDESEWLKYRSRVTGKSIEELRQEMSSRSQKADKSTSGFASLNPEQRQKIIAKSIKSRKKKE